MSLDKLGSPLFVTAALAFGLHQLLAAAVTDVPAPGPPWDTSNIAWGVATGALLVGSGLAIVLRWRVVWAARLLATTVLLRSLVYLPGIVLHLRDPRNWTSAFELLALGGASFGLVAQTRETSVGRMLFGGSLPVFGVQHFLYASFIATLIPAWIPARLFWAYGIGVCFCAAALAILTRRQAHLATTLLAAMFFTWVVILHLPRVIAASADGREWTSLFVALAMGAGSLILRAEITQNAAAST